MDMSKAALPPIAPFISEADRQHPRFNEYQNYRAGCRKLMIDASRFQDWLACREGEEERAEWTEHPQYRPFLAWMRETKAGARPVHGVFPQNFEAWLKGERW